MSATATYTAPGTLTPVLSDLWDREHSWTLRTYLDHGGYEGLKRAKSLSPEELITLIKDSGLRGRGGAGFPTGLKWSFLPPVDGYLQGHPHDPVQPAGAHRGHRHHLAGHRRRPCLRLPAR